MTDFDQLRSPLAFLQSRLPTLQHPGLLQAEQQWWQADGVPISNAIDRAGTPWVRMFDRQGTRVDEILYPPEYQTMLKRGYRAGVVWRALEEKSLLPTYQLLHTISFYDPGVCCPYTVSLGTAVSLAKYGDPELQSRFLAQLLSKNDSVWQGADRRQILHQQCGRGVGRCGGAARRCSRRRARCRAVPRASLRK